MLTDEKLFLLLKSLDETTARLPPGFKQFAHLVEAEVRKEIEADRQQAIGVASDTQHARDSAELRNLCASRDEARRERDLVRAELAGLEASAGHLGRLVDELRPGHDRYQHLRERDLDAIAKGGVFAGLVPDNLVLNGIDLDRAIDESIARTQPAPTGAQKEQQP